jgi:hypothetical protein
MSAECPAHVITLIISGEESNCSAPQMQFFPSSGYFISPAFDIQTSSIYVLGA